MLVIVSLKHAQNDVKSHTNQQLLKCKISRLAAGKKKNLGAFGAKTYQERGFASQTYQEFQIWENCVVLGRKPRIQFHPALFRRSSFEEWPLLGEIILIGVLPWTTAFFGWRWPVSAGTCLSASPLNRQGNVVSRRAAVRSRPTKIISLRCLNGFWDVFFLIAKPAGIGS